MAAKKRTGKKPLQQTERGEKRAEQKAQGALDGRFREKKVESKKRYTRRPKHRGPDIDTGQ